MQDIEIQEKIWITVTADMKWEDVEKEVEFHLNNLRERLLEKIATQQTEMI